MVWILGYLSLSSLGERKKMEKNGDSDSTAVALGQSTALSGPVDPAVAAAAEKAKALVQAAYMVALARPRSYERARVRILEACRRPRFAKDVEYGRPQGGKTVHGLSIRFAELALREFGNVRCDSQVIFENGELRRILVTVLDLETNSTFSREATIRKQVERRSKAGRTVLGERLNSSGDTVYLVVATEEEMNAKEASMLSKVLRNEGLRLIPQDIKDEAASTAIATMRDRDAKDPAAAAKAIIDGFASVGVGPTELEKYLGHGLSTVGAKELEELRGVYRALKDGEVAWTHVLSEKAESDAPRGASADPAPPKKPRVIRRGGKKKGEEKTAPPPKVPAKAPTPADDAAPWDGVPVPIMEACRAKDISREDVAIVAQLAYGLADISEASGTVVTELTEMIEREDRETILNLSGGDR
jgi:hypothetical protein